MNAAKRYFTNNAPDLETEANIDCELLTSRLRTLVELIKVKQTRNANTQDCDGGPYVGLSGISFMFWYLSQQTKLFSAEERTQFLDDALAYLRPALDYAENVDKCTTDKVTKVAYLLGNAGTYLVAALVFHSLADSANKSRYAEKYAKLAELCSPERYLARGSDELLVGRVGYICGAVYLNKSLNSETISHETIKSLGTATVNSGRNYASRRGFTNCPLMYSYFDTEYIGAAHGVAGILQVLLETPSLLSETDIERDIKKTVDFILSLQTPTGNFPCAMDDLEGDSWQEEDEIVHWCHGAPGVVWLMAKAYLIWKEEKYLNSCVLCADLIWKKGLLRKGPGICHGVAGNAYVFLLMYKLTNDNKYLNRANQFQEFIFTEEFKQGCRTPDSPYSLFEGFAGTVCFLVDLMQPQKVQFPLYTKMFE
ncbi:lanC-like protein 3 [Leptotrombidium deliense]|uniref:LanC-like protein 3 homolog n=1 Tax=Leptotrombidium deliense TaxID=299467 RepID=A0A443SNN3_9ACAR|nr:lanC-like protein 3 [Leptotrombidium deliense]